MKLLVAFALAATAASASAQPRVDGFNIVLSPDNQYVDGNGSGWGEGEWIYYDQTGWWNQWFHDDPPDPRRWKEISYEVRITPWSWDVVPPERVEVAINWSTLEFPSAAP